MKSQSVKLVVAAVNVMGLPILGLYKKYLAEPANADAGMLKSPVMVWDDPPLILILETPEAALELKDKLLKLLTPEIVAVVIAVDVKATL